MSVSDVEKPPISDGAPPDDVKTPEKTHSKWLRRILWIVLGTVVGVGLAGLIIWRFRPPELHGVVLQSPQQASDFTLTASTGERMSLSDLRGKYVLLYFGYTFCPDVCPTTLTDLRKMAETLGDKKMEDIQVVMVSVDPARDTPERMAEYLAFFDPRFLGMTGSLEDIDAAGTQFGVFFESHEGTDATGYLVDHTSTVILIDRDGYVRMMFPYGTAGEDIASDVEYMMRRLR